MKNWKQEQQENVRKKGQREEEKGQKRWRESGANPIIHVRQVDKKDRGADKTRAYYYQALRIVLYQPEH